MNVFNNYAHYYNLLYKDKDYPGEADYVHKLIQQYNPGAKSVLNLGCGTGKHDFYLVKKGYRVTGVDLSAEMLHQAKAELAKLKYSKSALTFLRGDVRKIRLKKKFDAVISLFHVISYMNTNKDVSDMLETAYRHLKKGGIFIFDCWYGPAVLANKPSERVKKLEDKNFGVERITKPYMRPNDNSVDIRYEVIIRDKKTKKINRVNEVHRMRYFFKPEIEMMMGEKGFKVVYAKEWLTGNAMGPDTWGACFAGILV